MAKYCRYFISFHVNANAKDVSEEQIASYQVSAIEKDLTLNFKIEMI